MRTAERVQWLWAHTIGGALQWALIGLVWVYQRTISPLLPPSCRYYPSCSAYAMGALRTHGAFKGVTLAGWRVLRCNPFSAGGVDPVPSRGRWRPELDGEHVDH